MGRGTHLDVLLGVKEVVEESVFTPGHAGVLVGSGVFVSRSQAWGEEEGENSEERDGHERKRKEGREERR